jgi:2-dehydropantoate 2-reductase
VIGGTIITGFEWRGPAQVHVSVEAGPIRLGRFPAGLDTGVQRLVELFRRAGLNVQASESIRTDLWAKTLYNCALNPLGAIFDVPYGRLADSHSWSII